MSVRITLGRFQKLGKGYISFEHFFAGAVPRLLCKGNKRKFDQKSHAQLRKAFAGSDFQLTRSYPNLEKEAIG